MGLFGIPSKKEREFQKLQIDNCRRIFSDSMRIMQTTDKIDTFMGRYETARKALYDAGAIAGENSKCLNGVTPKHALAILERDLPDVLIPCIDRYMRKQTEKIVGLTKGREAKAKGLLLLVDEYRDEMPESCSDYWEKSINKLISKIRKIESNNSYMEID